MSCFKMKVGPVIVNIDAVMETCVFPDSVQVKNYGCVQDMFENGNWYHDR